MVTVARNGEMIKQNILVADCEGKNRFGRPAFNVRDSIKRGS